MNYYENHIGDYDKATAHLTACEDGIYGRLLRRYYDTESPLTLDAKVLQRLVRARTREEKTAVETMLEEFFQKRADGWHHKRCDEEIARYAEKREKAKRSADARWSNRQTHSECNANASPNAMRTHSEGNAHQTPDTRHQYQEQEQKHARSDFPEDPPARLVPTSEPARACQLMRSAGCARINPSNPNLLAAIAEGVTPEALRDTYFENPNATNPFAWAIATARSRHAEGPQRVGTGPPRTSDHAPNGSKSLSSVKKLQGLKSDETLPTRLAPQRDPGRLVEARDAEP